MTMDNIKTGVCACREKGELDRKGQCPECAAQAYEADEDVKQAAREAATYQIETVADFLRVPEDRIADCLAEFADYLSMARGIIEQADIAGELIGAVVAAKIDPFEWTDDGRRKRQIEIRAATSDHTKALTWRKRMPTEPGWYWMRRDYGTEREPKVEYVRNYAGLLAIGNSFLKGWTELEHYEWSGPIQEPQDATGDQKGGAA